METKLNGLRTDLGVGGAGLVPAGDPNGLLAYLTTLGSIYAPPQANATAMAAMALKDLANGMRTVDLSTGRRWRYSSASTATDTTNNLVIPVTAGGSWIREAEAVDLKLAVSKDTADAAVLFTVPTGVVLHVRRTFWELTAAFTGGTSSAIGASSSNSNYSTKGDIQGGASGDLTAALAAAGYKPGTIGAKFGTNGVVVLVAGDTVRFDRIASVYTAGAGYLHLLCDVIG